MIFEITRLGTRTILGSSNFNSSSKLIDTIDCETLKIGTESWIVPGFLTYNIKAVVLIIL